MLRCPIDNLPCNGTGCSFRGGVNECCSRLPEEKKNTMENKEVINNDQEFLKWIYERMINVHGEKDLYDYMINFKSIIDRSGSVAAPKEEPKEESEPTQRINAAMLLAGFMWKDENKFPKQCVTIHHEKGVSIDETELMPYLMNLVRWVEDAHQLSSLRDQLRQRDELIKDVISELTMKEIEYRESAKGGDNMEYFRGKQDAYEYSVKIIKRIAAWLGDDSIIKKSQKL